MIQNVNMIMEEANVEMPKSGGKFVGFGSEEREIGEIFFIKEE